MSDHFAIPHLSEVVKFQNQDFDQIRICCSQNNVMWKDPRFCPGIGDLEWKRPWEISNSPCDQIQEWATTYDIRQGQLNNSYLVASMQALTNRPELLHWVVPRDQTFTKDNWGVVHFRLWQLGTWYDICVDDRLPTKEGKLVYSHSNNKDEFWCALLEKACAKLHCSFAALEDGLNADAMVEFSGGISQKICLDPPPDGLGNMLLNAYEKNLLLCATINKCNFNVNGAMKRLRNKYYTITRVHNVTTSNVSVLLVRLRNPLGFHEWTGPWSDKSGEWSSISDKTKIEIGLMVSVGGEFWMAETDFKEHFSSLSICHLSPATFMTSDNILYPLKNWSMNAFKGEWVKGISAGGKSFKTIHQNPQYRIILANSDCSDKDGLCSIVISLLQKCKTEQKKWHIGFKVFQLQGPVTLPLGPEFFTINIHKFWSGFQINEREIVHHQKLLPGEYCIIPCTKNQDEEGQFLLRVFTEKGVMEEINAERVGRKKVSDIVTELAANNKIPVSEESKTDEDVVELFCKVSGKDLTVDWVGLKTILDSLTTDIPHSPIPQVFYYVKRIISETFLSFFFPDQITRHNYDLRNIVFSKELCRTLISFLDEDNSGKIGFDDVDNLWSKICHWRVIYRSQSNNTKGYIKAADLREALGKAGFTLSNRVLASLIYRYADEDGQLSFDDFLMCVTKMHLDLKNFNQLDQENTGKVVVSLNEWLEKTFLF